MAAIPFRIQTPLRKITGLGPARSGSGHFWLQRLTGLANLILLFAFVAIVVALAGRDYAAARALLSQPLVALPLALFAISAPIHMRLGMQVVIEDYVHHEGLKLLAVIANSFFAIAIGAASLFAILKLAFGN